MRSATDCRLDPKREKAGLSGIRANIENVLKLVRIKCDSTQDAIEGNTLTLMEVKVVLEEGLAIGGKPLRHHLEVINHAAAISYLESLVKEKIPLDERILKELHQLVLRGISI